MEDLIPVTAKLLKTTSGYTETIVHADSYIGYNQERYRNRLISHKDPNDHFISTDLKTIILFSP